MVLQRPFDGHFYGRPLLSFPALSRDLVDGRRRPRRRVRFLQPLLQQRFQFAHIFEGELQRLEPADRRLREHVSVERAERQSDVRLRKPEFDAPLLKLLGELFQIVGSGRVLVGAPVAAHVVRMAARVRRSAPTVSAPQVSRRAQHRHGAVRALESVGIADHAVGAVRRRLQMRMRAAIRRHRRVPRMSGVRRELGAETPASLQVTHGTARRRVRGSLMYGFNVLHGVHARPVRGAF